MDDELLERLLQAPECAADEAPALARLLDVASTYPSTLGSAPGEEAALVAFRNRAVTVPSRRKHMLGKALAAKSLAAFAVGTLTLGGGVALADSTGVMPNTVGGHINEVVPFPGSGQGHHNGWEKGNNPHKTGSSTSSDTTKDSTNDGTSSKPADNHGADVSKVAKDKTADNGQSHGQVVSETARGDHGQTSPDVTKSETSDQNDATEHQQDAQEQQSEAPETESTEAPDTDSGSSGRPTNPSGGHSHGATG